MQHIFDEGYNAYWVGTDLSDNPYSPEDVERYWLWRDGWKDGELEADELGI